MLKRRKTPLRRCTGCGEMKNKAELIRVVRAEDGSFSIDATGKKAGRGAYVCPNADCVKRAVKSNGLSRSFKKPVPAEIYETLKEQLENQIDGSV
ncbi:MAG: YlxR family protein [Clostridiales bacterium]|jgi:predicted RNA-binding protein YlxR (DUF448 family)|nr:YlxR family protein [Clostridiales bacterium]